MTQRTFYAQGAPSWVDLSTRDTEAAKGFYSGVFGWIFQDIPMPGDGSYAMAHVGGETVAGIAAQNPAQMDMGVPPMWNTYLAVTDVDVATAAAEAAGGSVLVPPMDVMDSGRMSFVADPTGAAVGLWQAKSHIGAGLVNEPNTLGWNELITDNQAPSCGDRRRYPSVSPPRSGIRRARSSASCNSPSESDIAGISSGVDPVHLRWARRELGRRPV